MPDQATKITRHGVIERPSNGRHTAVCADSSSSRSPCSASPSASPPHGPSRLHQADATASGRHREALADLDHGRQRARTTTSPARSPPSRPRVRTSRSATASGSPARTTSSSRSPTSRLQTRKSTNEHADDDRDLRHGHRLPPTSITVHDGDRNVTCTVGPAPRASDRPRRRQPRQDRLRERRPRLRRRALGSRLADRRPRATRTSRTRTARSRASASTSITVQTMTCTIGPTSPVHGRVHGRQRRADVLHGTACSIALKRTDDGPARRRHRRRRPRPQRRPTTSQALHRRSPARSPR